MVTELIIVWVIGVVQLIIVWVIGVVAFFVLWAILTKIMHKISEKKRKEEDDNENAPNRSVSGEIS